ncbi:MAG TPA: TetR/AcrR family transcriptional regulator [Candidatus Dormibacteraeota bacterium]
MAIAALRPEGPNRERLCRAALRLFSERGYDGVSNREIVAACGLTKGAIYWYFEDKEDLFRTVVSEALASFEQRVVATLTGAANWELRMAGAMRLFVDVLESEDDPHRDLLILLVNRFPRGPGTDRLVGDTYALLVTWVEGVVAEHRPGLDGREIATLVHTAGLGVLAQAMGGRDVARPVLSALFRLISGGDELYPVTVAGE